MAPKCPTNVPEISGQMSDKCDINVPRMSPECPGNVLKLSLERLSGARLEFLDRHLNYPTDFEPFSMQEVIQAFSRLNPGASPGIDCMRKNLLPTNSTLFLEAYWCAANNAILHGDFPETWKKAKLQFFLKPSKSHKTNLSVKDFRPISCIPHACLLGHLGFWP